MSVFTENRDSKLIRIKLMKLFNRKDCIEAFGTIQDFNKEYSNRFNLFALDFIQNKIYEFTKKFMDYDKYTGKEKIDELAQIKWDIQEKVDEIGERAFNTHLDLHFADVVELHCKDLTNAMNQMIAFPEEGYKNLIEDKIIS